MPALINPVPFVFIVATAFGVLMHDTRVDHASSVALNPSQYSNLSLADAVPKANDHTHVERASVAGGDSSNIPKLQPRDDHNKYVQVKKHVYSGDDNGLWPSA